MGFSSFTCAKTHLPIMADTSWGRNEMTEVVLVFKHGVQGPFTGFYDGYGRISGKGVSIDDVYSLVDPKCDGKQGIAKMVLKKFWKGETYSKLGRNHHEPGQGHFHDSEALKRWFKKGGFKTIQGYRNAYNSLV